MEEELEPIPIVQIPEYMIRAGADEIMKQGEANNVFTRILSMSQQFKEAGMTPIYLYDMSSMNISLVVLETFGKKLH